MKNKFLLALASGLMALSLAGCPETPVDPVDPGDDPTETDEGRQYALEVAKDAGIALVGGNPMLRDEYTVGGSNICAYGSSFSLLKEFPVYYRGDKLTYKVTIEWSYNQETYGAPGAEKGLVKKWEQDSEDETRLSCSFNYDTQGVDKFFDFKGVLTMGEFTVEAHFDCTLKGREMKFVDMTHEQFYEVAKAQIDNKEYYYFKNWQPDSGTNFGRNSDYYYDCGNKINVYGKLVYLAPDGNFGYIENGGLYLALYHVDYSGDYELFKTLVGKYLVTSCYIASYYGYPQLSNQSNTRELTGDEIDEHYSIGEFLPTRPMTVTAANLGGTFVEGGDRFNQFSDMHHRYVSIRAFYRGDRSKLPNGKGRFTFDLVDKNGENPVAIQYNYHCNEDKVGEELVKFLKETTNEDLIELAGYLTYSSPSQSAPDSFYAKANEGKWTITPVRVNDFNLVESN